MGKLSAEAIGLPILRESPQQAGVRELRIVYTPGGMVWDALTVLRLVETRGRVDGALFLYWRIVTDSAGQPRRTWWQRGSCGEVRSLQKGIAYCEVPSWHVSWRAVADSVERLGVWRFVAPGELSRSPRSNVTDQDGIFVEAMQGGRYGSVDYYAPGRVGDSTSRVLQALAQIVTQIAHHN